MQMTNDDFICIGNIKSFKNNSKFIPWSDLGAVRLFRVRGTWPVLGFRVSTLSLNFIVFVSVPFVVPFAGLGFPLREYNSVLSGPSFSEG